MRVVRRLDHRDCQEVETYLDASYQKFFVLFLFSLLLDGHFPLPSLEEPVLKRVTEMKLCLLILVQTLVSLPGIPILRL